MTEYNEPRYMMATKAVHMLGDISRDTPDLCSVHGEDDAGNFIGCWVTGYGFIGVRFPKETTRELTQKEIDYYNTQSVQIASQPPHRLNVG